MTNYGGDYEIVFSPKVIETFERYKREYQYSIEAGGIIVGKTEDKRITIIDITEPYEEDKRSRYTFKRASKGHQEYMDEVWSSSGETLTYLGEWHTHDQQKIFPSPVDYSNWKKIMSRPHNSEIIVFIILGRKNLAIWIGTRNNIIYIGEIDHDEDYKKNT